MHTLYGEGGNGNHQCRVQAIPVVAQSKTGAAMLYRDIGLFLRQLFVKVISIQIKMAQSCRLMCCYEVRGRRMTTSTAENKCLVLRRFLILVILIPRQHRTAGEQGIGRPFFKNQDSVGYGLHLIPEFIYKKNPSWFLLGL